MYNVAKVGFSISDCIYNFNKQAWLSVWVESGGGR